MPFFSGSTTHLATEAEWDELLDRFCDMACSGEQVTFRNTGSSSCVKAATGETGNPCTISTQSREELKEWMKKMEKAGKTVNVTYNEGTGTWNGKAYLCFNPQEEMAVEKTCKGKLLLTEIPVMDDPVQGKVWALYTDTKETLILTHHGMMMMDESGGTASVLEGYEVSFSGLVSTFKDKNGKSFQTLELVADVIIL